MKRTAYLIAALAALLLMALVPAYAQKTSATVNIPFAFTVDDVRMPAGDYRITSPSEKVLSIQRVGGSEVKVTLTTADLPPGPLGQSSWCSIAMATPTSWPRRGCRTPITPRSSSLR